MENDCRELQAQVMKELEARQGSMKPPEINSSKKPSPSLGRR